MTQTEETYDGPPYEALRSSVAALSGRCGPFKVGDVEIGAHGRPRLRASRSPLQFGFAYRGVLFKAEVQTEPQAWMSLTGDMGKLPYTVELGEGRRLAKRIIDASGNLPHGRIELSEDQDIRLVAQAQAPAPLTPASIMATMAALLLEFKPYIELLLQALEVSPRPGVVAG